MAVPKKKISTSKSNSKFYKKKINLNIYYWLLKNFLRSKNRN
ncbi:hypothetical protein [Candidatus Vidania fulgoroideorum]